MKTKKVLSLMAMVVMLIVTMGLVMACGNAGPNGSADTPAIVDHGTSADIRVSVGGLPDNGACAEGAICSASTVPGAINPFELFGNLIGQIDWSNSSMYDPWNYAVDYSGGVSGGQFNQALPMDVGRTYFMGASTNGKLMAHGFVIGGTPMTHACILGTAPYTYGVVSWIVNRDETGQVYVTENPACTAVPIVGRLVSSGDSQTAAYDDMSDTLGLLTPYDGVTEGAQILQSSATNWTAPQTMATFIAGTGWAENFYGYATAATDTQIWAGWFSIYRDATIRTAVPPVNGLQPGLGGVYLNIYDATNTTALCVTPASTELVHWEDLDATANYFYAALVDRVDSTTYCPVQQADNRNEVL